MAERTNHVSVMRETRAPPAQAVFLLPEVKKVYNVTLLQ